MPATLMGRWRASLQRLRGKGPPELGPVLLNRRRIYVLPTRSGIMFGLVLLAMLLGAINYNNSLGYALTFLLVSLGIITILHTFRNLHRLTFHAGHPSEAFAGGTVRFPIAIENPLNDRFAIALHMGDDAPIITDIAHGEMHWLDLYLTSPRRGRLALPAVTVTTLYPLGLFRAWSYLRLDVNALIYPAPAHDQPLPNSATDDPLNGGDLIHGSDDFAQLRPYQAGDSLRHIFWKAFAREQGLLVKQFGAARSPELWLTWEAAVERGIEARLALLCRWILKADAAGIPYGLLMPGQRIEPGLGEAHRRQCLEILALHGTEASHHG